MVLCLNGYDVGWFRCGVLVHVGVISWSRVCGCGCVCCVVVSLCCVSLLCWCDVMCFYYYYWCVLLRGVLRRVVLMWYGVCRCCTVRLRVALCVWCCVCVGVFFFFCYGCFHDGGICVGYVVVMY